MEKGIAVYSSDGKFEEGFEDNGNEPELELWLKLTIILFVNTIASRQEIDKKQVVDALNRMPNNIDISEFDNKPVVRMNPHLRCNNDVSYEFAFINYTVDEATSLFKRAIKYLAE